MLFRIFHMIPHQKQRIWLFAGLGSRTFPIPCVLQWHCHVCKCHGARWAASWLRRMESSFKHSPFIFYASLTVTNLVKLQAKKLGIAVLVVSTESMRFVWAIASANIFQAIQMLRKMLERICLQHLLQAFGLSFMAGSLYSLYSIHCIQIMSQSSLQKDSQNAWRLVAYLTLDRQFLKPSEMSYCWRWSICLWVEFLSHDGELVGYESNGYHRECKKNIAHKTPKTHFKAQAGAI